MKQHNISYKNVSRETYGSVDDLLRSHQESLNLYLDLVLWWNKRINLISRNVPRETIMEHIRHSLLITGLKTYNESEHIVDSGTGGGLPGLPLAIISEKKQFVLNDIVTKKTLAVKHITRELGLENISVKDDSISELVINKPFLLITKHAFKIPEMLDYAKKLPWSSIVFYKGTDYKDELRQLGTPLNVDVYSLYEETRERFYEGKFLIEISK